MSAYKDALHIKSDESGGRLALALELLTAGRGVVVLDGLIALRPESGGLTAEVIAQAPHAFIDQVMSAKDFLASSTLGASLGASSLRWLVVEDYGTGTQELWRAS